MKKFNYNNLNVSYNNENVCTISLNRHPVNALSTEMLNEIKDVFEVLDKDNDLRVIILNTNLHHFSAGADLKQRSIMNTTESFNALNTFKNCFTIPDFLLQMFQTNL